MEASEGIEYPDHEHQHDHDCVIHGCGPKPGEQLLNDGRTGRFWLNAVAVPEEELDRQRGDAHRRIVELFDKIDPTEYWFEAAYEAGVDMMSGPQVEFTIHDRLERFVIKCTIDPEDKTKLAKHLTVAFMDRFLPHEVFMQIKLGVEVLCNKVYATWQHTGKQKELDAMLGSLSAAGQRYAAAKDSEPKVGAGACPDQIRLRDDPRAEEFFDDPNEPTESWVRRWIKHMSRWL